jgi:agmatine/peptidylarginine deiminase
MIRLLSQSHTTVRYFKFEINNEEVIVEQYIDGNNKIIQTTFDMEEYNPEIEQQIINIIDQLN